MNKLEDVARRVLEEEKARGCLAEATLEALRRYVNQMLALAESAGFIEPCQELYDAFAADDRGSVERRSMHVHVNKLVDAVAGTRAVNPGGMFYNEPDAPTAEEVEAAFGEAGLPVGDVDVLVVAARADAEMAGFGLTQSTMGQYRHAWRELAAYLQVKSGSTLYDEAGAKAFADEARNDLGLPGWRRKIRRKAVTVLVEVAMTGTCEWRIEREVPHAPTEELEALRADYTSFLRARNLATSTIGLQDWGLRRMLEFSGASTLDDVASFGADHVAAMVGGFSGICTTRSLSTALPVVRRALDYLGETGRCRAGLSGLVMTPYSQRGGEVTFLPVDDEMRLVQSLREESARDRAMILLALRLGLRDSDIRNLRFDEIDWVRDPHLPIAAEDGRPVDAAAHPRGRQRDHGVRRERAPAFRSRLSVRVRPGAGPACQADVALHRMLQGAAPLGRGRRGRGASGDAFAQEDAGAPDARSFGDACRPRRCARALEPGVGQALHIPRLPHVGGLRPRPDGNRLPGMVRRRRRSCVTRTTRAS